MQKTIAAATLAAAVAAGSLTGAALGAPAVVGAAETAVNAAGWVQEALGGLVADGTITQEQADAVESALEEARPEHGIGHRFEGRPGPAAAGVLGITEEALRTALADGQTIADVAADQGVDVESVIAAIVGAMEERLDELVAAGDITRARADEILANTEERATALVNGELPGVGRRGPGLRHGGPGWGPSDDPAADGTSA